MRYFISDLHLFHKLVHYKYRKHNSTIDDMHQELVNTWNKTVKSKDTVYVLGDVTFGKYEETQAIIQKLNGIKILIRGNHDERFTAQTWVKLGFTEVRDTLVIKKNGEKWILSHFPYSSSFKFFYYKFFKPKQPEANYYKLYLPYKGYKLLHGHHHTGPTYKFNQVNVAFDVNRKLLSENEILDIFEKNKVSKFRQFLETIKLIFF